MNKYSKYAKDAMTMAWNLSKPYFPYAYKAMLLVVALGLNLSVLYDLVSQQIDIGTIVSLMIGTPIWYELRIMELKKTIETHPTKLHIEHANIVGASAQPKTHTPEQPAQSDQG